MLYENPAVLLGFMLLLDVCKGCPSSCVCKWKNGKQTVECNDRDLLIIPKGMDTGTQVLEFNGNNLNGVHNEEFLKMDLINLQRIYLSRCRIKIIDDRSLKGLTNLVELDLSRNLLENVPTETFLDCPSLMKLTLSYNPIKVLRKSAFNHLSFLSTLDLSNCELSKVIDDAFQGLINLELLHLNGNKLTSISGLDVLPKSLKRIELQKNLWECDCHLKDLHEWLLNINIVHTVEPVCKGPTRLSTRTIKSISDKSELACLPDVSPTSFFLEVGEGKNISLLCNIKADPEATVSWWFQGQLLQNDSFVAPGLHLLYYIQVGELEKQSELFIYNTNQEDNGTFVCTAENPAGITRANFTIRVVLQQLQPYEPEIFPLEYVVVLMATSAVSLMILLCVVICGIAWCQKAVKSTKRHDEVKVAASSITGSKEYIASVNVEEYSSTIKESALLTCASHDRPLSNAHVVEEILRAASPVTATNEIRSPTSIRRYQLEQNPDLINGTETVGRRRLNDGQCLQEPAVAEPITKLHPHATNMYVYSPDVHLTPVALFNPDEPPRPPQQICYRTLPYNRPTRRHSAANPISRFSREAEFLARSSQPSSFEHYCPDIRYTADGYPARTDPPSPPESHMSDSVVSGVTPCCSGAKAQWASCVPAKKSVGAQTQTEDVKSAPKAVNKSVCSVACSHAEVLTESPDEGYEGESLETSTS